MRAIVWVPVRRVCGYSCFRTAVVEDRLYARPLWPALHLLHTSRPAPTEATSLVASPQQFVVPTLRVRRAAPPLPPPLLAPFAACLVAFPVPIKPTGPSTLIVLHYSICSCLAYTHW